MACFAHKYEPGAYGVCRRCGGENPRIENARLIADLQAVTIGIHLVGLDRLPEVMGADAKAAGEAGE